MNKINKLLKLDPSIKMLISIGNPGEKYAHTRHNAGHILLDILLDKNIVSRNDYKIFKSSDFMNKSGEFVSKKLNYYKFKVENLLIIHDDLDLKIGEYKLQFAKGPKVHNGLLSIEKHLRSQGFWRLRVGIENRSAESHESGMDYVLNNFTSEEKLKLAEII